ncbi:MAG: pseudouridine-5-phosphate glycosidase [Azospirillum sp.]|nr:pseudouridine-5-phosphate glycosidase [Azospirillum sp.]
MHDLLAIRPEVAEALTRRRPVVALESTLIAHGLPAPRNLEVARLVEAAVREGGAVPATIAVVDGRIRIGLDDDDLERLALGPAVPKLSRRDLAIALAAGGSGATTVAATMKAAALAGIEVFATGGIGGVHRGASNGFDVSADIEALARIPVAVVSAGAKAILDLPRTLELLESRGVPVIGFGTDHFPAFYTRSSGLSVAHRLDEPAAVARVFQLHARLGGGGVLVVNPIPEAAALDPGVVEAAIIQATAEAAAAGVAGPALTPYLLRRLDELTAGASLDANQALVVNNATLASAIALALANPAGDKAPLRRLWSGRPGR